MYINLLSENIKVTENDNYETYIDKCLYEHFHDFDSINLIKKRLTMDFFTIKDILTIINYNKNISDYIKSSEKVTLLGRL